MIMEPNDSTTASLFSVPQPEKVDNEQATNTKILPNCKYIRVVPEDQQPLLRARGAISRFCTIHTLFITILMLCLLGGVGIGVWLMVVEGMNYNGGSTPGASFILVNRSTWGAMEPKTVTLIPEPPARLAVIIHTVGITCDSQITCSFLTRAIQKLHMERDNFSDIAYNFLVGGDGRTYEGRGWNKEGAFSKGYNNVSLGIAFMGTFERESPPKQQLDEAKALLDFAVKKGVLASDYFLVGHCELEDTLSPGSALFKIIKSWPHWKDCYEGSCLEP